jgi:hypothetical protein
MLYIKVLYDEDFGDSGFDFSPIWLMSHHLGIVVYVGIEFSGLAFE